MGGFIKGAIRRPGRMKRLARRHGISVHEEMVRDRHARDPSLRAAANLGLRLTGGDLAPKKKRKRAGIAAGKRPRPRADKPRRH
jgi:hypothetical protein